MSCSSGLNSITAAKSSAVLQRSSHSSLWRRLFWRQLPLTFCANRLEPSASILSRFTPKSGLVIPLPNVRIRGAKRTIGGGINSPFAAVISF